LVSNISILLSTLKPGSWLEITGNPLDTDDFKVVIPTLLSKGVFVTNDTPYTLTYTAGVGGYISGINPQYVGPTFNGTAVTAVPNSSYSFNNWGDSSDQNPRLDTNVNNDINVTANFSPIPNPFNKSILVAVAVVWICICLLFIMANAEEGIFILIILVLLTIAGLAAIVPFL